MRLQSELSKLLACPQCGGELDQHKDKLQCQSCAQSYPFWAGLPWLMSSPELTRLDWSQRLRHYTQTMQKDIQALKLEQKFPDLLPPTLERLRLLIQAKTEHLREIEKLLEDLTLPEGPSPELQALAQTPLPEQTSLLGYYANVMRDWAWGERENEDALAVVMRALGEHKTGHLVVLGSGPSRLAYDVHRARPGTKTLAVDINPFYLLVAARLISGKNLQLYNFPMAPRDLKSVAIRYKCKAPEALREDFSCVLADARQPCFRPGSVDTLLTPWLIDVIPEDFRSFVRRLNSMLKMGGVWVNFGSLVFHQVLQHQCYSREEAMAILEESGFALEHREDSEIGYLHDPHNCQKRQEWILCFRARKIREVAAEPFPEGQKIAWVEQPMLPIPQWPELHQQIFTHHTLAVVLAHINGERSLLEMADILGPQMNLSPAETVPLLQRVLGRAYEQRARARSF